jgi:TRAP-type C4-dicarboxylate transport system permease small subunit
MFETKDEPLLTRYEFLLRLGRSFGATLAIVIGSLAFGSAGYHYFGGLSWIDALLNAAMILTGMGPVNPMPTVGGKLFSTFYALYSGIAFLTMMAVMTAPLLHRLLHKFHLDDDDTAIAQNNSSPPSAPVHPAGGRFDSSE